MNSIIEAQQELLDCKSMYQDSIPDVVSKLAYHYEDYPYIDDDFLTKTSCVCGDSQVDYHILTDEIQEDLNNPCPCCGTTLNEDNYNTLQKVEKVRSWVQRLRSKLMKLLMNLNLNL